MTDSRLVIDLCGGAGATAQAVLDVAPARTRVVSLDSAAAMQRVGRRTLTDSRLSWITAPAEQLADHVHESADAVVCNSAIWKTDVPAVFTAVRRVLRPSGRFVFNIGGGFAGITHPDEAITHTKPSLNSLIQQIAARDFGYVPPPVTGSPPKLPLHKVTEHLATAGMTVVETEVTAQHSTIAEKKAWLSIPVFSRPDGTLTFKQRMQILEAAYALIDPGAPTVTSWLVVVAQRPGRRP
ncbi:class I SAM-dependent methyltransferase [Streptomyces sp. NBC_01190]|uniref:class I SAM-dependent methyltransferase n=1 Tax=Streptomyces sp. NBC_01190 TaxID=2903767 RepID=UPI003866BF13|nr:class I SAM-dependent methyltransferase [Streptomyces sp. NBC_01190]